MAQQYPLTIDENSQLHAVASRGTLRLILTAMRPYQWTKNLFLLAPLLFGMKLGDQSALINAAIGTVAFCLLSSALYLLNDIVDADADRAHPQKRLRPIASGALSTPVVISSIFILLIGSFALAFLVGIKFGLLALAYCVVTLAYCFAFKHAIVLDGMLIATGFVLRVVAGAIAVNVLPTHWLIVCAFLLALFLAFSKRRQELLTLSADAANHRKVLGLYTVGYLDRANNILLAATIVCYALYTVAPETVNRFGTDKLIYGSVFVIYGLLRYLALLQKSENGGNPSKMLLKDMPLLLAIVGWAIYNSLVIYRLPLSFLKH
jgi:4-hydroxybenzoate polyprenyltransferase